MKSNEIPDIFQSKIRLAIMTSLIDGKKDFKQLKELTEATNGINIPLFQSSNKMVIFRARRHLYTATRALRMHSQQLEDGDLKSIIKFIKSIKKEPNWLLF